MTTTTTITNTERGTETNDGIWLSKNRIPAGMTHAILWPRTDDGFLIGGFARSRKNAERTKCRLNRRITNVMCPRHVVVGTN